jgi:DNA-binding NarL/FixJ family response regulator
MDVRLSCEERAILGLAAQGLTTDEIADRLGLTATQVRGSVVQAMRMLCARTKLEAIVAAARLGQIELERSAREPA